MLRFRSSPPSGGSELDLTALEGAASDPLIGFRQTGDAGTRLQGRADGSLRWGDGTGSTDLVIWRRGSKIGGVLQRLDFVGGTDWGDPAVSIGRMADDSHAIAFGTGGGSVDVTLRRYAAATLEIKEAGGGFRFRSPDGTVYKTLSIDNSGAPVWA